MADRLSDLGGQHLAVPLTSMLCCLFQQLQLRAQGGQALFPPGTQAFLHSQGDEVSGGWFWVTRGWLGSLDCGVMETLTGQLTEFSLNHLILCVELSLMAGPKGLVWTTRSPVPVSSELHVQ